MANDTFRLHVPPHRRSMQEQTLDALLRIEELLTTLVSRHAFPAATPDLSMSQFVNKEDLNVAKASEEKPKGGRDGKRRL